MARHAWQLDGYRPLAAAPTGIASLSLQQEGFEDVATCDRLLAELEGGREQLDPHTVLVVDEAGMAGSRNLTRLLEHAGRAQAKVVLVGDDRQLSAIDAGGGFRALRVRLGASELVENRRQRQAWEREALDLVRSGLVEEAVAAYQAHDRVVAADSKTAATAALLTDWWQAWQQAERDRLGPDRLQVEDRQLRVGDRVVCGHNAIDELGVANGTRGLVTALDANERSLAIRLDGPDGRELTLPKSYLDGRGQGERNRRVDLAYATTGHRAQGLTRGRALVRLTGQEDVNWLYVQLSRARQETRLYAVVGPEPQGGGELRREHANQALAQLTRPDQAQQHQPHGRLRLLRRDHQSPRADHGMVTVATQLADRAAERERELPSTSSAGPDGWRAMRSSATTTGGSSGSWPGSGGPADWSRRPWTRTGPAMSGNCSVRSPNRSGVGGPAGRPSAPSRPTGTPIRFRAASGGSVPSRGSRPSGWPGSKLGRRSTESTTSNAPNATANPPQPAGRHQPTAKQPIRRHLPTSSGTPASAVAVRSGPPASTPRRSAGRPAQDATSRPQPCGRGRLDAAVSSQSQHPRLATRRPGRTAHRPAARRPGAAGLDGPARPGHPRLGGQHRPPADRPGWGSRC